MVAEMWDNRDGYNDRGDDKQQQMRCRTTEMAKCVRRTVTEWGNLYRECLPT